jgi:hypothetical protein
VSAAHLQHDGTNNRTHEAQEQDASHTEPNEARNKKKHARDTRRALCKGKTHTFDATVRCCSRPTSLQHRAALAKEHQVLLVQGYCWRRDGACKAVGEAAGLLKEQLGHTTRTTAPQPYLPAAVAAAPAAPPDAA